MSVCPSVRPSVKIVSFRGILISNWPINLKIGLNVRERQCMSEMRDFYKILIASCKFMQNNNFCK